MTSALDDPLDPRKFIAEHASRAAYWSDLASEAATIPDDPLLLYATRKAAAYARAFVSVVKETIVTNRGGDQ